MFRKVQKKSHFIVLGIVIFCLGVGMGYLIHNDSIIDRDISSVREVHLGRGLALTNPLLDFVTAHETSTDVQLRERLVQYVQEQKERAEVTAISVFFQRLDSGVWFGVHEKQQYDPASLLKLPLLVMYLRLVEDDDALLSQAIRYDGSFEHNRNIHGAYALRVGGTYTIETLLRQMIVHSDNTARDILSQYLVDGFKKKDVLLRIREGDLLMPLHVADSDYKISPETYAALFRVLYNTTYLSQLMSEYALALLTETTFTQGIVSGVAEEVRVAHKYGYGGSADNGQDHQVHDCGVVYIDTPYLLCIFTQSNSEEVSYTIIRSIAETVHAYVYKKGH